MPSFTNVKVLWNQGDITENAKPKTKVRTLLGWKPEKEEENLAKDDGTGEVLFDGSRFLSFKIFDKAETLERVTIVGQTPDGPLRLTLPISENDHLEAGNFVHQMAARQMIQDLETKEISKKVEKKITELGLKYGLQTRYTSFVGVDKETKKTVETTMMVTRQIDQNVPFGFGGMVSKKK